MEKNIRKYLCSAESNSYFTKNGTPIIGQSVSCLMQWLRDDGWKGLGNIAKFETIVENYGFCVVWGKNERNQTCRVVTLK